MNRRLAARLIAVLAGLLGAAIARAEPTWIDVRSPEEYRADHIEGDPNLPFSGITQTIEAVAPARDAEIVLYCDSGIRSSVAKMTLGRMGYTNVRNAGGIDDVRRERAQP